MVVPPATPSIPGLDAALSRRRFLQVGAAVGGSLLLGFSVGPTEASLPRGSQAPAFTPDAFIRIDRTGLITLIIPQVEMGQGIYTALSMILAEELDADFARVRVEHAPPSDALYANPALGFQATGASTSVRAFWMPMRKAGASVRAMLVEAAAATWRVDPSACRTSSSAVIHEPSGRKLDYGALVDRAAHVAPPKDALLKSLQDFRLIGQPARRLDSPGKVNGQAVFGIDVLPPGCKIATLKASPVFGGKVVHVDETAAHQVPGVRQVVVLDDLVAVVGDHMWAAKKGLEALKIAWDEGPNARVTTGEIFNQLQAASERAGIVAKSIGNVERVLDAGKIEATYHVPLLAHAPMEPMNCTVHVTPDSCEVWVGIQVLSRAQAIAAKITGLPLDKVTVHNHLIGGGFGRRLEVDGVAKAVRIAQQVEGPVKVIWTREEDIQQAYYRPFYLDRLQASVSGGKITAWSHRVVGSSIFARWIPPAFVKGLDADAVDGAVDFPYAVGNIHVEYVRQEPPAVTTCFWRGVGPTHNLFVVESFVDELAHSAGKDPVAFRREQLQGAPRLRACLDLAAEKAGWGTPLPARVGRGVAVQGVFGSYLATIAEVQVDREGEVKIKRMICAVDCGVQVNPDTITAQIQGGLIFGLSAALHSEITLDRGRVQQSNFHDYRIMRINEAPAIEVYLVKSDAAPGGIGEPGTVAAAPALANALFAATGIRLRHLPIDRDVLSGRKPA